MGEVRGKKRIPGGYTLATRMRQRYTIYLDSVAVNGGTYLVVTPPENPVACALMRVRERAEKVNGGLHSFQSQMFADWVDGG
jgi:hypothetical protein